MAEATGENPTHLNNHHLDTLSAIYSHPVSHNIRWVDVLHLLEAAGTAEEKHDGKFTVTLGEETEFLSVRITKTLTPRWSLTFDACSKMRL